MSISTTRKFKNISSPQINEGTQIDPHVSSQHLRESQIHLTDKEKNPFYTDCNKIEVFVSDAEASVIINKAAKAGLTVSEYMLYAALGFPMSFQP